MRVVRETGNIVVRIITLEMIQHQKRIEVSQRRRTDAAMHRHTGAFGDLVGLDSLFDMALHVNPRGMPKGSV